MEPIPVPAPPKSAFNRSRRVSDLLLAQLKHFQHVEHKQGIAIDPALSRDIHTESGAARYIAQITRAIQSQAQAKPSDIAIAMPAAAVRKPSGAPADGLALAAAAASPTAKAGRTKRSKRKKP